MATRTLSKSQESRINDATRGLIKSYPTRLGELSPKCSSVICDYISALRTEIKLSNNYRRNIINTLIALSRVSKNKKQFKDFTRADIVTYLNQFRKEDSEDPTHRWIGTYNTNLIHVSKFFKWLYFPNIEPTKRSKPELIQNFPKLRRLETSRYDPSDMWDAEDNLIFLKYCPNPRDRCYHAMEWDCSARPHELLNLRIRDIEFIDEEGGRYAKLVVNGKTGQRPLALIDSLPYVTQWISLHPQGSNREAILLPNIKSGKAIQVGAMFLIYKRYKKYFTSLLSSEIPEEDKTKIRELLKKPWNPYVHRHSALTEKSGLLNSDQKLRQYAGWSISSNMNRRYIHLRGGESMNDLLKAKGIVKDENQSINILEPKKCPYCKELNKPDAQFCFKCNLVMSFEAYQKGLEERENKDQEIHELKDQMSQMRQTFESYHGLAKERMNQMDDSIRFLTNEITKYQGRFGPRPLTEKEGRNIDKFKKEIQALPTSESIPEYDG